MLNEYELDSRHCQMVTLKLKNWFSTDSLPTDFNMLIDFA